MTKKGRDEKIGELVEGAPHFSEQCPAESKSGPARCTRLTDGQTDRQTDGPTGRISTVLPYTLHYLQSHDKDCFVFSLEVKISSTSRLQGPLTTSVHTYFWSLQKQLCRVDTVHIVHGLTKSVLWERLLRQTATREERIVCTRGETERMSEKSKQQ